MPAIRWARAPHNAAVTDEEDKIESAYRFLLADLMPFGKNAVIHLEHGGKNESTEHYETVTYWYGLPTPSLVETDRLQIGDAAAERAHGYSSPQASAPYTISSRYEWGVDSLDGKVIYPEQEDRGRTTKGASEFRLRLRPDNLGVLLRRKLDYSFPDQRAEVYIADKARSEWKLAGIWYLAGSNTVCLLEPEGGTGSYGTQRRNLESQISRRRIPRPARADARQKSNMGADQIHSGEPALVSRLSHRRSSLERDPLHRLLLHHAQGSMVGGRCYRLGSGKWCSRKNASRNCGSRNASVPPARKVDRAPVMFPAAAHSVGSAPRK